MKKSDLKKIIREEIVEVLRGQLNEAFGDPIAAKLSKMAGARSSRWTNFWRSAAKSYDIAWDKLPKGSFRKVQPTSPDVKKGMAFYVINQDVPNPFASSRGWAYDNNLRGPAVLAVTVDNKIQYYGADRRGEGRGIGPKISGRYSKQGAAGCSSRSATLWQRSGRAVLVGHVMRVCHARRTRPFTLICTSKTPKRLGPPGVQAP